MKIRTVKKYLSLVPRPTTEEYNVIKESILIHGQREPITVNKKGWVLDGHTRFEVLHERGMKIRATVREFESDYEEELYVIQCNLHRRQLTVFQKAELTYDIYKITKARMKRGGDNKNKENTGGASAIIGRTIGCNRNMVQQCAWLIENADDRTKGMLRNGTMSVSNAYGTLMNNNKLVKNKKYSSFYIPTNAKLQCPCCKNEFKKKELVIVK